MVHVPSMFMKAWKIIYPFIDDNTKQKVQLQTKNAHLFYYICRFGQLLSAWKQ